MKRIINVIHLLLLMPLLAMSQTSILDEAHLMAEANRFFESGEYKQAKVKYSEVYLDYGSPEALVRVDVCAKCLNLLSKAMYFEHEDDYTSAIVSYQSILILNSKDPNVAKYIANCKKKQYQPMLDKAHSLYREGNYRQAQSNLNQYIFSTGVSDEGLSNSIAKCINLLTLAEVAYNNKNYTQAENYYNQIVQINSTDINSKNAIVELRNLRSQRNPNSQTSNSANTIRTYKIGDRINFGNVTGTIAFLDDYKEHGWAIVMKSIDQCSYSELYGKRSYFMRENSKDLKGGYIRCPTIYELRYIYNNDYHLGLGLDKTYWSQTEEGNKAYYLNFESGKEGKSKFKKKEKFCFIFIIDF